MSKKFDAEKIEEIRKKLQALPRKEKKQPPKNKSEAIAAMKRDIQHMQAKNYSLEEIAEFLTVEGVDITAGTLKSYLNRSAAKPSLSKPLPAAAGAGLQAGENPPD